MCVTDDKISVFPTHQCPPVVHQMSQLFPHPPAVFWFAGLRFLNLTEMVLSLATRSSANNNNTNILIPNNKS